MAEWLLQKFPMLGPIALCLMVVGAMVSMLPSRKPRRSRKTGEGLDKAIFHWNSQDSLTIRDLLLGGILAFGRTGAGKTSAMKAIFKAILKFANSSMLVMCAKQGEAQEWVRYCEEMGRGDDVVLVGVNHPARFNMVGYEADRGGVDCAQQIVRFISDMRTVVMRESPSTGGESQQWQKQDERAIGHAVTILLIAKQSVTPQALHDVIMSAPQSVVEMKSDDWVNTVCNRVLRDAHYAKKTPVEAHDFKLASDYWTKEWPNLADRTRASILVGTIGVLTALNTGQSRELFANYSNITPKDAIEGRKIVIVDLPPDDYGDLGRIGNCGWKYHWQREVLRREITDDSPITCIVGDEASIWVTPSDTAYLSRCRSYKGCMVYICQSLEAFREVMPGDKGHSAVEALLANFSHRLIFALGDHSTATWAADLVGKELQMRGGGSTQYGEPKLFEFNHMHHGSSFTEQVDYLVQPARFLNGFRTGGPINNFMVDALLIRSGEAFSNGRPILEVSFDQRT